MDKTNGDVFRAMANEDIAVFAAQHIDCCACPLNNPECISDCKGTWLDYLELEATSDANN